MTLPELLCPAGDLAALKAAVDNGADAVYLGYSRFGARASATNFDDDTLAEAVRYAHLYHARVHATVNTLVKQNELQDVRAALRAIAGAGVDAVIVQDIGVAAIVRREFPALALHASTQMALMNAADARWALKNGFCRVVLARERALQDIREVAATGIETEVFVHGALCSAVSGRCLMSSMSGGRSGNRGRCAQPCRQRYTLGSREGALMSMRDLCLIDDLPALCDAGVCSLKIEGRLKSAEYVAVVTSAYRRALDDIARDGRAGAHAAERRALEQIFNRGGFTRGHAMGDEDAALCDPSRVDHNGVAIGEVTGVQSGFALVKVIADLNDGDSLRISGARDVELRYSGNDVPNGQVARVRLRAGDTASIGDGVARLADARQLEAARAHAPKPIPVTISAELSLSKPARLTISDGENSVTAEGAAAQGARNAALTQADAIKQLGKLGGTPFTLKNNDSISILMNDGLFVPVSELNALRRSAAERLIDERIRAFGRRRADDSKGEEACKADSGVCANTVCADIVCATSACPDSISLQKLSRLSARQRQPIVSADALAVIYSDPAMSKPLADAGAMLLIYEPLDYRPEPLRQALDLLPKGAWLQLPQQATNVTIEAIAALVCEHAEKLGGVCLGSIGQLSLGLPLPAIAGDGIPVCNREAMQALSDTPLCGFTLWSEWTKDELLSMAPMKPSALLKVYGREPLMLLNHCPERVARGLKAGRESCAVCDDADTACGIPSAELTDRMGYRFPLQRLRMPEGCVLRVLGALPTLVDDESARRRLDAGALLRFTDEPPERQTELTRAFSRLIMGDSSDEISQILRAQPTTSGHWRRVTE